MFKDDRGRGEYNIFPDLKEGQINLSTTYPGVIRAFHRHQKQWDHWKVVSGNLQVVLVDDSTISIYYLGEGDKVLSIPPGVWHGFRVLGNEPAKLLYLVTNRYDPSDPDEEREDWNKWFDWETEFK